MIPSDWVPALHPLIEAFKEPGVPYQIGGSLASSAWGLPRSTQAADLAAGLRPEHAAPLAARLAREYYADEQMIREAVEQQGTFNLLHLDTMLKVDVFVRKPGAFEDATFARARPEWLDDPPTVQVLLTSPEDIILRKLVWYRLGGEVSERQWLDVLGVLKVQGAGPDVAYLEGWAKQLDIGDLLARARSDAGLP